MSTHYILDLETPTLADSVIRNVRFDTLFSPMTGGWVVRIPDGLNFKPEDITGYNDLITAKYAALLESYPGFSNILFDAFEDGSGLDASTGGRCAIGGRGTSQLYDGGSVDTVAVALGGTPSQAVITWELFLWQVSNPRTDRLTMNYLERSAANFSVDVSFNNGSTFITGVADGGLVNIDPADQGSNLILRFTHQTTDVGVNFGSWAVIY